MINKQLLSKIKKDLETYQKERNLIIGESRKILQAAKKSIFDMHGGKKAEAKKSLDLAEQILAKLNKEYNKNDRLRFEGSYKASLEEYVEAKMFYTVMQKGKLSELKISSIGAEEYIGGLADLTGELVRQAVLQATAGNYKELNRYKEVTDEVVSFLLSLYLTGHNRQKFDEVKRNLKRLEQIIYEVSIRD